jgi:DNA-binding GntR family transcriptional regulator
MSLQHIIYNKIKKLIINGELSPGEKLSEVELAKNLNSSRTPIREAFRQLQMEGYIVAPPNKGAYVCKLPAEEIENVYDIICLLEGYAAERAATKIQNAELNNLVKLKKRLLFYASNKKYRDYIELNTEFHRFITQIGGNPILAKTVTELRSRIYRYRLTSVTIPGYLEKYALDHEKIINALKIKDPVRARKLMGKHVSFVKDILVNFLKENPGY